MRLPADRRTRYAIAGGTIALGFACAAVDTGPIGGALATIFLAVGLILFLAFLLRDLGLTPSSERPMPSRPPARSEEAAEPPADRTHGASPS